MHAHHCGLVMLFPACRITSSRFSVRYASLTSSNKSEIRVWLYLNPHVNNWKIICFVKNCKQFFNFSKFSFS